MPSDSEGDAGYASESDASLGNEYSAPLIGDIDLSDFGPALPASAEAVNIEVEKPVSEEEGYLSEEVLVDCAAHSDASLIRPANAGVLEVAVPADVTNQMITGAVQSLPNNLQSLALHCVGSLADPQPITPETPHSLGTQYWTADYFQKDEPRRATSWAQTADSAGLKNPTKAGIQRVKACAYEAAELVYLSSRLFVGAFAARIRKSIDRKQEEGIALFLHGEMDEATYKLRVPTKRGLSQLAAISNGDEPPAKRPRFLAATATDAKFQYSEAGHSSWGFKTLFRLWINRDKCN